MADLLKCPFCGGEAEIWEDKVFVTYVPQCKECNAQRGRYINKENAIKAWNTRKPMEAVVAELEKKMFDSSGAYYCGERDAYKNAIEIVKGKE